MKRRDFLWGMAAAAAFPRLAAAAGVAASEPITTLAASWRAPQDGSTHFAGALEAHWATRQLRIRYQLPLPSRPHGLTPEPDGGMLVIAVRPGQWLLRCDGEGRVSAQVDAAKEHPNCRLNGHAIASADGALLFTSETDQVTGRGKIGVRDARTLKKQAEWDSHGLEPHHLLLDASGQLVIANGGIPRTAADKKYDLHRMDSSLVRLNTGSGELLGRWRLDDAHLSLRHLAWDIGPSGHMTHLGIAMQAEHEDASKRARAPVLAVWDGDKLFVPTQQNDGLGYVGDIAPAHDGGFAISSHQSGRVQLWHPDWPDALVDVARLNQPYALAGWQGPGAAGGVLISSALGLARWHPQQSAEMIPWPQAMVLDNHWSLLADTGASA